MEPNPHLKRAVVFMVLAVAAMLIEWLASVVLDSTSVDTDRISSVGTWIALLSFAAALISLLVGTVVSSRRR